MVTIVAVFIGIGILCTKKATGNMITDREREGFHRYGRFEVIREGVHVKNIEGREAYTKNLNWRDL